MFDLQAIGVPSLEGFKAFPLLQELELSLNGIADIIISQKDFSMLQVTDIHFDVADTTR